MNKRILSAILGVTLALSSISSTCVFASNSNTNYQQVADVEFKNLSKEMVKELKDELSRYNVDDSKQKDLLLKLDDGQAWDSLTKGKLPFRYDINTETLELIGRYDDGSIIVTAFNKEDLPELRKRVSNYDRSRAIDAIVTVSGGTVASSSAHHVAYQDVLVKYNAVVIKVQYYVSWTKNARNYDTINKIDRERGTASGGGSVSNLKIVREKMKEDINGKAQAYARFDWKVNSLSGNAYLYIYVGSDQISAKSW